MYPSFIVGIILRKYQNIWQGKTQITVGVIIAFILLLIFWDEHLFTSTKILFNNRLSDFLFNCIYKLLIGLAGALAIIFTFNNIFNKITNNFILSICKMGQYTLGVYILQTIIIEKELPLILSFNGVDKTCYTFAITPIISLIVLLACVLIIKLISLSKKLSLLCFGKI